MNKKKRIYSIFLAILGISLMIYALNFDNKENILESGEREDNNDKDSILSLSSPHMPIHIDGNWSEAFASGICTGNGSEENPWKIEDYEIDGGGSSSGIFINNTSDYFIIENCTLFNSGSGSFPNYEAGIKLINVTNGILKINNISNNLGQGIYLNHGSNITIFNNTINENQYSGIYVSGDEKIEIRSNILGNNNEDGCELHWVTHCAIIDNEASSHMTGITLRHSEFTNISNNRAHHNGHGISVSYSDNNTIENNVATDNNLNGIYIDQDSKNNTITDNIASNNLTMNQDSGIYIKISNNNTLCRNVANDNNQYGLQIEGSNSTFVTGNIFNGNPTGISESDCEFNQFITNIVDGICSFIHINEIGSMTGNLTWDEAVDYIPWIEGEGTLSHPYKIEGLIIDPEFLSSGITIEDSSAYAIIENCTIYNSFEDDHAGGICLQDSANITVQNCNISNNRGQGIYVNDASNITIFNNTINENQHSGIYVSGDEKIEIRSNILENNVEDGCELHWVTHCTIIDNEASSHMTGITLRHSEFTNISNNRAHHNGHGISVSYSDNNTIEKNVATDNNLNGIFIHQDSKNNTITDNIASNNLTMNQDSGFYVEVSNNNTLYRNVANDNNQYGLQIEGSNSTFVTGNIFNGNSAGIDETNSEFNEFISNIVDGVCSPIHIDEIDNMPGDLTWDDAVDYIPWIEGEGTLSNPFKIEGITIEGESFSSGISIEDSTAYALVENCTVYGSGSSSHDAGIFLDDTANLIIQNCNISNNRGQGIYLNHVSNITIFNNTINENRNSGIYVYGDEKIEIRSNVLENNDEDGCELHWVTQCAIIDDEASFHMAGINLRHSEFTNISGNRAHHNGHGISVSYSDNNTIEKNVATDNNLYGIYINQDSKNNTITDNIASNNLTMNQDSGFYVKVSNNNTLYRNVANDNRQYGLQIEGSNSTFVTGNIFNGNPTGIDETNCESNQFLINIIDGVCSPIHIDEEGSTIGAYTWDEAVVYIPWIIGKGTLSNPYKIEDVIIDAEFLSSGITIEGSSTYAIIDNCTVYNSGSGSFDAGITLSNTKHSEIINNYCYDNQAGISLIDQCFNNSVKGNRAENNYYGIKIEGSSNGNYIIINILTNNGINLQETDCINNILIMNLCDGTYSSLFIDDNGGSFGAITWAFASQFSWCTGTGTQSNPYVIENLYISDLIIESSVLIKDSSAFFVLKDCTIYNLEGTAQDAAIQLYNVENGELNGNDCSNSESLGIYLRNSHKNRLTSNIINNNEEDGVFLLNSNFNNLSGQYAYYNLGSGIYLQNSHNNSLKQNNLNNNQGNGIRLKQSHDNILTGNIANYNALNGIILEGSYGTQLLDNTADLNDQNGISLLLSDSNSVSGNLANSNSQNGIFLDSSHSNLVTQNTVQNNTEDLKEINCVGNTIENNILSPAPPEDKEEDPVIEDYSGATLIAIAAIIIAGILGGISVFLLLNITKRNKELRNLVMSAKRNKAASKRK